MQKKVVSFRSTSLKVCIGDNTCLSEGKDEGVTFGELESFSDSGVLTSLDESCTLSELFVYVMLAVSVDKSVECTPTDDDVLQELNKNNPRIVRIKNTFFTVLSISPPSGDTNS